jgi:hypothetical protein
MLCNLQSFFAYFWMYQVGVAAEVRSIDIKPPRRRRSRTEIAYKKQCVFMNNFRKVLLLQELLHVM